MTRWGLLGGGVGEMRAEALDLCPRSGDHRLQVDDELLVYRVVRRTEGVKRSRTRSVKDSEHGQLL